MTDLIFNALLGLCAAGVGAYLTVRVRNAMVERRIKNNPNMIVGEKYQLHDANGVHILTAKLVSLEGNRVVFDSGKERMNITNAQFEKMLAIRQKDV